MARLRAIVGAAMGRIRAAKSGPSSGPGGGVDDLLLETGEHLLLESGDAILLE